MQLMAWTHVIDGLFSVIQAIFLPIIHIFL